MKKNDFSIGRKKTRKVLSPPPIGQKLFFFFFFYVHIKRSRMVKIVFFDRRRKKFGLNEKYREKTDTHTKMSQNFFTYFSVSEHSASFSL